MKSLLILRHAKSSWSDNSLSDHQRPLNRRGLRDAPRVGEWIRSEQLVPDRVLSSTAERAITTARIVAEQCAFDGEIEAISELYLAAPQVYLDFAAQSNSDVNRILMIGHNPGIEQLVSHCSQCFESMPTAALAWIKYEFDEWSQVQTASGQLQMVWRPKEQKQSE